MFSLRAYGIYNIASLDPESLLLLPTRVYSWDLEKHVRTMAGLGLASRFLLTLYYLESGPERTVDRTLVVVALISRFRRSRTWGTQSEHRKRNIDSSRSEIG